jgi:two-component system, chemotaxis family, sensor histidine kinase and response regulator WspE
VTQQNLDDFSISLLELFRLEAENQTAILTGGLLELERSPGTPQQLQALLRALHSLKGAARIVNLQTAVRVAHAMEDCFVAAQHGTVPLGQTEIDLLLRGVDLLLQVSNVADGDIAVWEARHATETRKFLQDLENLVADGERGPASQKLSRTKSATPAGPLDTSALQLHPAPARKHDIPERMLRLTAENLNRLLGLAGESLVESRWLRPFSDSLQHLKRLQADVTRSLDGLSHALGGQATEEQAQDHLAEAFQRLVECQQFLREKLDELDLFDRRSANLSHRLYLEVLRARMRPFGDGVRRFPRMVRDLARALGKDVRLEIRGDSTHVDRDILDRLEAPLMHLLRNAVDHGCETRAAREQAGKPAEGVIRLEAHHSAGMLLVTVVDDGAGIDPAFLRQLVVKRKLTSASTVEKLGDVELLEFLFLPGFTMRDDVTEISGRGMGLDVVQNMVKSVRGSVRVSSQPGRGTRFQLQLPLTLSVLRTLLVNVGGEPYAIPLARISRTLRLPRDKIQALEGRHYFTLGNQQIGLLTAHQVLDCEPQSLGDELPVVVLGERSTRYGLIVDRFLGERELVVHPLDPRLGRVKDIHSAALMEDGSPVLIIDVEDILSSIERLIAGGMLAKVAPETAAFTGPRRKRILAVDDSLTVRELERKLLASKGYLADVAVDGMDGWNAVRTGRYDLVITDVDMPRMDGIELATLIKKDAHLKSVPVVIVSYKEGEEDRLRGLEAGADYYLTKGSFHDETLLQAVTDLIGDPEP